jgi:hypothetical protein
MKYFHLPLFIVHFSFFIGEAAFLHSRTDRTIWPNAKTKCFDCHASQKDKDFVFGSFRK